MLKPSTKEIWLSVIFGRDDSTHQLIYQIKIQIYQGYGNN